MNKKITYKDAGVDIKKADEAIEMSKKEISSTFSKHVLSSIGTVGGSIPGNFVLLILLLWGHPFFWG